MNSRLDALDRDGFVVLRDIGSPTEFERALAELGEVVLRTPVELRPNVGTYLCRSAAVPLHTDHPDVDVVAWWCERQDEQDGASILVDALAVIAGLDERTRTALGGVPVPCPTLARVAGGPCAAERTVVSASGGVYFAAWLSPTRSGMAAVWRELAQRVEDAPRREVRLGPGEALFVDNRRMLHGRRALAEGSTRRLCRAWLVRPQIRGWPPHVESEGVRRDGR